MTRPKRTRKQAATTPASSTPEHSTDAQLAVILEKVTGLEKKLSEITYHIPSDPALTMGERIEGAMRVEDSVRESPLLQHVRANAAAREALIQEFGVLSSAEVAELAGSTAGNRAAAAHRWKSTGAIFSVPLRGEEVYPAFQFDPHTQRPRPAIRAILQVLTPHYQGWQVALWFTGGHAYLSGERPVDVLMRDAQRVVTAAQLEREAMAEEFGDPQTAAAGKRAHSAS